MINTGSLRSSQSKPLHYSVLYPQDTAQPDIPQAVEWSWQFYGMQGIKRVFDVLAASIGLMVIAPLLLLITGLVAFSSPGPILYKSLRLGQNKKPFYMYKFRTMVVNAEQMRAELYQKRKLQGLFKLSDDPRVTPIGQFLRTYSLDELPQLLNVLKGEMSLVGPRPYIPEESQLFKPPYTRRFEVMPGMTGLWQVSGRSDLRFEQLCSLDLRYVETWNLWADLKILLKTFSVVLFKKGAY